MRPHRKEQLSSQFLKELSSLVLREIEFNRSFVTLTGVDISSDLQHAAVGVSAIPSAKAPDAVKILNKNKFFLQRELLKKLKIRHIPKIIFKIDHGPENAAQVEKILISK